MDIDISKILYKKTGPAAEDILLENYLSPDGMDALLGVVLQQRATKKEGSSQKKLPATTRWGFEELLAEGVLYENFNPRGSAKEFREVTRQLRIFGFADRNGEVKKHPLDVKFSYGVPGFPEWHLVIKDEITGKPKDVQKEYRAWVDEWLKKQSIDSDDADGSEAE